MKFNRIPLLMIDGADKSGKTSFTNYINKRTNYQRLLIDRGIITTLAYCELFDRPMSTTYVQLEKSLLSVPHICIHLFADESVIQRRFKEHNEPDLPNNTTIKQNLEIIKKYYDKSILNKIEFDTGHEVMVEMFDEVVKKFNSIYR